MKEMIFVRVTASIPRVHTVIPTENTQTNPTEMKMIYGLSVILVIKKYRNRTGMMIETTVTLKHDQ